MAADLKTVVFVDMLGFAALTENHPLDVDRLKLLDGPILADLMGHIKASEDPLAAAFHAFHSQVRAAIGHAEMKHRVTSISFSDSAFIATDQLFQATDIASRIMLRLLQYRVPVRIGIGYGTFAALRFSSDVSDGRGHQSAHFLGTAVVRSHAAEHSGLKGLRIFLDPSTHRLLADPQHNPVDATGERRLRVVDCPEDPSDNTVHVAREVNYWWRQRVTDERKAWLGLQEMWNASPSTGRLQYQSAAAAINRMRVDLGEPAMDALRRRTLPKRTVRWPDVPF